ncbi:MAG: signal peptidase II [Solirubrobacterales bacterium]
MSASARAWVRALALGAIVVLVDQVSKAIAASALGSGERIDIGLGFELADVRNRGIAFGLLSDGQMLVIVVTALSLALILGYFALNPARPGLWIGVGLLLGGAVGNLADRVRADEVTDFIDPPMWPAFNVADIAIVIGILLIVLVHRPTNPDQTPLPRTRSGGGSGH